MLDYRNITSMLVEKELLNCRITVTWISGVAYSNTNSSFILCPHMVLLWPIVSFVSIHSYSTPIRSASSARDPERREQF